MRINTHILSRNFLLLLFVVYFSQELLYSEGSLISKVSLLFIILISFFYFVNSLILKDKKQSFYIVWTFLLVLNVIGFIITGNFDEAQVSMFKNTIVCSLTFYPFFYYGKRGFIKEKHFMWFFSVMLLIVILQFYKTSTTLMFEQSRENVVNNIAYMFVLLIPFVFLIRRSKLISGVIFGVIMLYIIMANKRGALITGIVGMLFYVYYQLRTIKKHNRFKGYIVFTLLFASLIYFAYQNYMSNEYMLMRMQQLSEGNTSYRTENYTNIINTWVNSKSIVNLLFGFGFAASLQITGIHFAHNDWVELLSNFGLLGVVIYFSLFFAAFKYVKNISFDKEKKILLLAILAMWFMTTLYSMWYTSLNASLNVMLLGYLFGSKDKLLK